MATFSSILLRVLSSILIIFSTIVLSLDVNAQGGVGGPGGGGKNEPFFNEVAKNLRDWILSGNADALESQLPPDVTLKQYKSLMISVLNNYNVSFTDKELRINGYPKTCIGWRGANNVFQIQCNNGQFGSDTPDNINNVYRVVHHEFARLACRKTRSGPICLENNRNENSDYRISELISGFLRSTVVMRLPVESGNRSNEMECFGESTCAQTKALHYIIEQLKTQTSTLFKTYVEKATSREHFECYSEMKDPVAEYLRQPIVQLIAAGSADELIRNDQDEKGEDGVTYSNTFVATIVLPYDCKEGGIVRNWYPSMLIKLTSTETNIDSASGTFNKSFHTTFTLDQVF